MRRSLILWTVNIYLFMHLTQTDGACIDGSQNGNLCKSYYFDTNGQKIINPSTPELTFKFEESTQQALDENPTKYRDRVRIFGSTDNSCNNSVKLSLVKYKNGTFDPHTHLRIDNSSDNVDHFLQIYAAYDHEVKENMANTGQFYILCKYDILELLHPASLEITNQNDNVPQFQNIPYKFDLHELTPVGMTVFHSITAVDPDGNAIDYELKNAENSTFDISSYFKLQISGNIILERALDFDQHASNPVFHLLVVATDSGKPPQSASATVTITLKDDNDLPPSFYYTGCKTSSTSTFPKYCVGPVYYAEFPKGGLVNEILPVSPKIEAKDMDVGIDSKIEYSISNISPESFKAFFKIYTQTAEIVLTEAIQQKETKEKITLTIMAKEKSTEARSTTAVLIVTVAPLKIPLQTTLSTKVSQEPLGVSVIKSSGTDNTTLHVLASFIGGCLFMILILFIVVLVRFCAKRHKKEPHYEEPNIIIHNNNNGLDNDGYSEIYPYVTSHNEPSVAFTQLGETYDNGPFISRSNDPTIAFQQPNQTYGDTPEGFFEMKSTTNDPTIAFQQAEETYGDADENVSDGSLSQVQSLTNDPTIAFQQPNETYGETIDSERFSIAETNDPTLAFQQANETYFETNDNKEYTIAETNDPTITFQQANETYGTNELKIDKDLNGLYSSIHKDARHGVLMERMKDESSCQFPVD